MLLYVYAAVIVLCFVTFRSWRVVAVVPLMLTSILCEALMVGLGMGVVADQVPGRHGHIADLHVYHGT
jgi:hypothetical protein